MDWIKESTNLNISQCMLCDNAPCTSACPKGIKVGDVIRSLYFYNLIGAKQAPELIDCHGCDAPCQKSCISNKMSCHNLNIPEIVESYKKWKLSIPSPEIPEADIDLSTDICGVKLENPFMLSSSVVGSTYDMCARAFEMGWAGVSFKTICNFPQHEASPRFSAIFNHGNSFAGFKNIEQLSDHSVMENMEIFRKLKKNYPNKVIVASIMGANEQEWEELARCCQEAGADVIECNFSCPNMENPELGSTIGQSAEDVERFTAAVRRGASIPVLAKLTPNITDMVPIAIAAKRGGADGIAAINTINSVTGVDLQSLVALPNVNGRSMVGGYSGKAVKPIALRFISDLAKAPELEGMHISGMGGIENWADAAEFIALGSSSLQVTTSVMEYGYRVIDDMVSGLRAYLSLKGIKEVKHLVGAAVNTIVPHDNVERDTILLPLFNHEDCIGCGRCYLSCRDGGHQAISFNPEERVPHLNGKKCVGCHLCALVCPVQAISVAKRRIHR